MTFAALSAILVKSLGRVLKGTKSEGEAMSIRQGIKKVGKAVTVSTLDLSAVAVIEIAVVHPLT